MITVHFLVKNEERFIGPAVRSVLPLASRVLVYDTGSTDRTLEILSGIRSEKIELVQKKECTREALTRYRNEMMDRTETEWFMLVDGDEVYPARAVDKIPGELRKVPDSVDRIVIQRRHFIRSLNLICTGSQLGRIYRTRSIRFRLNKGWYQAPYLVKAPNVAVWDISSVVFPKEIFFFHFQYCQRSSKDQELGNRRAWRRAPFPVLPYFGPWPDGLDLTGTARGFTPRFLADWTGMNAFLLSGLMSQYMRKTVHKLKGGPPVPGGIQ